MFVPTIFQTRAYRAGRGAAHSYDNYIFDKFPRPARTLGATAHDRIPDNNNAQHRNYLRGRLIPHDR